MVGEVIGTVSYLNGLMIDVSKIYFIGRVSLLDSVRSGIDKRLKLVNISGQYAKNREFGNAVGTIATISFWLFGGTCAPYCRGADHGHPLAKVSLPMQCWHKCFAIPT